MASKDLLEAWKHLGRSGSSVWETCREAMASVPAASMPRHMGHAKADEARADSGADREVEHPYR